ncbi:MAG: hypothetical protein U0871_04075 [Gemmataceae bacterium]
MQNRVIYTTFEKIYNSVSNAKRVSDTKFNGCCPAHSDNTPSLGVELKGSKILMKCLAGCETDAVLKALGLPWRALFDGDDAKSPYATVARLADAFHQDIHFLNDMGLRDDPNGVIIPYFDPNKTEVARTYRTKLWGKGKFHYPPGTKAQVYGEWMPTAETVYVVEGESDCWTLWAMGEAARGVPGASNVSVLKKQHVAGVKKLVVLQEDDAAGEKFVSSIADRLYALKFPGELHVIQCAAFGFKDISEIRVYHQGDVNEIAATWKEMVAGATKVNIADEAFKDVDDDKAKPFQKIIKHALGKVRLFTDNGSGIAYASYDGKDVPVMSGEFARHLMAEHNRTFGLGVRSSEVKDAQINLVASAVAREKTYRRVANTGDKIVYDLGDGQAVTITGNGWRIGPTDVKFIRADDYGVQVEPKTGGSLDMLRKLLSNFTDDQFALYVAYMLDALKGHKPYLQMMINGAHGSGKTTATAMAQQIIDPCLTPECLAP